MSLNHINLVVTDAASAIQFFETYFGFNCIDRKGDDIIAVLKGSDDFTLVVMKAKEENPAYPNSFHIGFMLESEEKVNETYHKLKAAAIVNAQEPKKIRDSFGFYFTYQNVMIEIGHYYQN